MSRFQFWYHDDNGDQVEITDMIQAGWSQNPGTDGLVMNAEEGTIGISSVTLEDPLATFDVRGHRQFYVTETACVGDAYDGRVYTGYTADRVISRENEFTGSARTWKINLVDINTVFDRRIMEGSDSNRPAETDVARITWALSTNEAALIDDSTYFSSSTPYNMDAADYRGQSFRDIFDDCAQQSGKNWYVWQSSSGYSLWYAPKGTSDFASLYRISNDLSVVSASSNTFPPSRTTTLTRDPSRVYSGVHMAYANSFIYVQRESTATTFARRDAYSPAPNLKTKTQAKTRANRYLTDISTEEDVISTAIIVPRANANCITQGQRVQVKFTHLPNYEDFVWTRVLNRTVRELNEDFLELAMELSPDEPATSPSSTVFATLQRCIAYDVLPYCYFAQPGDTPLPGDPTLPTVGPITFIQDLTAPYAPGWSYNGMLIGGDGTIDVKFYTSTIGIIPFSVTFAITLNGIAVVSRTQYNSETGYGNDLVPPLEITGLAVSSGDILRATVVASPQGVPFFRSPRGTGNGEEALTITGGSLV